MAYNLRTSKTWSDTMKELGDTMDKGRVDRWKVECVKLPRYAAAEIQSLDERTVTLRYTKAGNEVVLSMNKQDRAVDNLRVLYLAVEAMRMNEVRGIGEVLQSAYAQLPPPKPAPAAIVLNDPYSVLGASRNADLEMIEAMYKVLVKRNHPDAGGDPEQLKRVVAAMETIRKERAASSVGRG